LPDSDSAEHSHEALTHDHEHHHVTHNFNAARGGFEHLSARHAHQHDHGGLIHSHHPHEDFDREHAGEAHEHDHGGSKKAPAKKTAATKAKKAAGSVDGPAQA